MARNKLMVVRPFHLGTAVAGVLALTLVYAADCGPFASAPPDGAEMGPKHHPIGKPMPATPAFNQPNACGEGFWFYDRNRNTVADPAEPRLYGQDKTIACASCHAESPDVKSAASASVFLRQDASTLCLVCHNL
jgi:hypothetical protein